MDVRNGHARRFRGSDGLLAAFVIVIPIGLFVFLRTVPGADLAFESLAFHQAVVSLVAAAALIVAIVATVVARRSRQPSVVFLAMGCLGVGFFMTAHGLTTPGVAGQPMNLWVARTPTLAIVTFALTLSASLVAPTRAVPRFVGRHPLASLLVPAAALTTVCLAIVALPAAWIGSHWLPGEPIIRRVVSAATMVGLLSTAVRYRRRWLLGRDRVQFALVLGSVMSAEALLSLEVGRLWHLSWWDYHALLLAGFGTAVAAIFTEYRRVRTIEGSLATMSLTDPLQHIAHGYPEALRALVAAVEARDVYTHGHSARVAELSVRIAQRMGMGPSFLRTLAQGALLHDIGKIGIPDQILNKNGPLAPDERAWIEQHPVIGDEMVRQAPSLRHAYTAVRHHHERRDGTGYPDGLMGNGIPLEARIVAVADVWDAMRSDRAYRPAWAVQQALDHMEAGRGLHFDPACLDPLLEILAQDGLGAPSGRPPEGVADAVESCHHYLPHAETRPSLPVRLVNTLRHPARLVGTPRGD
jgi:HD-GYP domain-containing protein (c-di-GMP phosphodiesterase class II)